MRKDNPAVFECTVSDNKLHYWIRRPDGTAECKYCPLLISKVHADEVFDERFS